MRDDCVPSIVHHAESICVSCPWCGWARILRGNAARDEIVYVWLGHLALRGGAGR